MGPSDGEWKPPIRETGSYIWPFAVEWFCSVLELLQVHTNQNKCFVQTNKRGVIVLSLYWKTKWFRFCHGGACFAQPEKPTFRAGEPVWERASIMVFVHLFTTDWTLS